MERIFKIEYAPEAQDDVQSIANYITNTLCAEQATKKLLSRFRQSIETLQHFPLSGTALSYERDTDNPRRWIRIENYLIFYALNVENETVYILRILYGPSNFAEIL